jgi:hypothetical protein
VDRIAAEVCARSSASAGSSLSVGSQDLRAPFGSFLRLSFGTSDCQAIRAFLSQATCNKPRGPLATASSTITFSGRPRFLRRTMDLHRALMWIVTLPWAFDHLQRLLRGRCKSVERSFTKHNFAPSSKSRCRSPWREALLRTKDEPSSWALPPLS